MLCSSLQYCGIINCRNCITRALISRHSSWGLQDIFVDPQGGKSPVHHFILLSMGGVLFKCTVAGLLFIVTSWCIYMNIIVRHVSGHIGGCKKYLSNVLQMQGRRSGIRCTVLTQRRGSYDSWNYHDYTRPARLNADCLVSIVHRLRLVLVTQSDVKCLNVRPKRRHVPLCLIPFLPWLIIPFHSTTMQRCQFYFLVAVLLNVLHDLT